MTRAGFRVEVVLVGLFLLQLNEACFWSKPAEPSPPTTTTPPPATCPTIVSRADWSARAPTGTTSIAHPVPKVIIHHTVSASCSTQSTCSGRVRQIQNYHMDNKGWDDIGYNFLIGEDGNVYEGRGWDRRGAHETRFNSVAIGISFIGDFTSRLPNAAALDAAKKLISCGAAKGKLSSAYTLHGHRDAKATECPGTSLYNHIRTWPHFRGRL